jgi:hypothetical protein
MDYQNILIGAVAGLVLSQLSYAFNKVYDIVYESEQRRDTVLHEKISTQEKRINKLIEQVQEQCDVRDEFLRNKSLTLDKKLSLVMSKLVAQASTGKGDYKTSIGLGDTSMERVRKMEEMIQAGDGAVAQEFQRILHEYGERVDVHGNDEPVEPEVQRLQQIAEVDRNGNLP